MRQRGITVDQAVTVMNFGRDQRVHGATRYFLDKKARALIAVCMPEALSALKTLDIQVVVSDEGKVITVAHRTKRIRLH